MLSLIPWIVIFPLDSIICPLYNWAQLFYASILPKRIMVRSAHNLVIGLLSCSSHQVSLSSRDDVVHFISQQVDIKAPVKLITIPSVPAELLKMDSVSEPFTSPKCLTSNFSLSHLKIIQQKDNENSQTYQIEVFVMIHYNVLRTNSQGNV